jgi:hypothetical protein
MLMALTEVLVVALGDLIAHVQEDLELLGKEITAEQTLLAGCILLAVAVEQVRWGKRPQITTLVVVVELVRHHPLQAHLLLTQVVVAVEHEKVLLAEQVEQVVVVVEVQPELAQMQPQIRAAVAVVAVNQYLHLQNKTVAQEAQA